MEYLIVSPAACLPAGPIKNFGYDKKLNPKTKVKLPAYKAGHQKESLLLMIIHSVFPSLAKRGQGRFLEKLFVKSPFSKGGDLKGELFIPVYKTGYSSSFLHK